MCKVFIDTNVFLGLYQTNKNNLENIFEDISKLKSSIVFVDQVSDEFLRNRDKVLTRQIQNVSKKKIKKLYVTSLIKSLEEFSELKEAGDVFNEKHQKLIEKLEKIKDDLEEDIVYKKFYELYNDSALTIYNRTGDIIDKAHKRMLMGNPPIDTEKNTIGDQIIWETLISNLEDNLIFITFDGTYENHISFLKKEYKDKVHKVLSITEKVSFALSKIGEIPSKELINYEKYDQHSIKSIIETYNKSPIESVSVNLRNFKLWFLDILDIDVYYEDGTEVQTEDPKDLQFSTILERAPDINKEPEMYVEFKEYETEFKKEVSSILERTGYGKVDVNAIEYDIVEYIPPKD